MGCLQRLEPDERFFEFGIGFAAPGQRQRRVELGSPPLGDRLLHHRTPRHQQSLHGPRCLDGIAEQLSFLFDDAQAIVHQGVERRKIAVQPFNVGLKSLDDRTVDAGGRKVGEALVKCTFVAGDFLSPLVFLSLICGCKQRRGSGNNSFRMTGKILRLERRRRALLRD